MRDDERDHWTCVRCGGPTTGQMVGLQGDSEWECLDCGLHERVPARSRLNVAPVRRPGPRFVISGLGG